MATERAAHVPGPWRVRRLKKKHDFLHIEAGRDKTHVAMVRHAFADEFDWPTAEANARRIVAAVNACEGIPTEALEEGVVGDLLDALEEAESVILGAWGLVPAGANITIYFGGPLEQIETAIKRARGGAPHD